VLYIPLLFWLQATEYAQNTILDADGVHQSTAENATHESTRTAVGRFSAETETYEDVQKTKP